MTAGQPTVGIFSPIGPSTAPSARAASGVSVRPSGGHLEVVNGWLTSDWDGTKVTVPGSMAEYWFKDHADLALPATVHPVELSRAIHSLKSCFPVRSASLLSRPDLAHLSPVGGSHPRTSTPQAQRLRRSEESLRNLSGNYLDTHRGISVATPERWRADALAGGGRNSIYRSVRIWPATSIVRVRFRKRMG